MMVWVLMMLEEAVVVYNDHYRHHEKTLTLVLYRAPLLSLWTL
jgi:hypothetical protein